MSAAKVLTVLSLTLTGASAFAGDLATPSVIPRPASMDVSAGTFTLGDNAAIVILNGGDDAAGVAAYLAECLKQRIGRELPVRTRSEAGPATGDIVFIVDPDATALGKEAYRLIVTPERATLAATAAEGLFRGVQTLRQLLRSGDGEPATWTLPVVNIVDHPRFRWRGLLLDCGRHFVPPEMVKRYIDLLAYHKMNVLHWHLTEDQGWRIEIKRYPRLTEVGAWRGTGDERYGGFYSQDEIRDIVAYAAGRYVTIVPEIEMPGHSMAALAAYPELSCTGGPFEVATTWGVFPDVYCAGNEQTFEILEGVLDEVLALFPSEFIHVGGDECPKDRWAACPKCQARIKAEGLADEHELQSYFIRRIERYLASHGRRLIGWDEILEGGLPPGATVQSWRGMQGAIAAATADHDVIASPTSNCYLDYAQAELPGEPVWMGYVPLEQVYAFEPTPAELTPEQARHVLGVEGNMWTEHAPPERLDHQLFPRLCAMAEVGWSPQKSRDLADFVGRLRQHYRRLDELGVAYFIAPPACSPTERTFDESVTVTLEAPPVDAVVRYTLDGSEPTASSPLYEKPLALSESTVVSARMFLPGGRSSDTAVYRYRRLRPLSAVDVPQAQNGVDYAYYEGQWRRLPDFDALTPGAAGHANTLSLDVRRRDDYFGIVFCGFIEVPADGRYTFYLRSNDGSRLSVGGEVIAEFDGQRRGIEATGDVLLTAGRHAFELAYFQINGGYSLDLDYAGPDIPRQQVPPMALWRSPGP
ncbi:MAG: family 20 glycosylhydrolase [Phycisphaerae bacterium]